MDMLNCLVLYSPPVELIFTSFCLNFILQPGIWEITCGHEALKSKNKTIRKKKYKGKSIGKVET